jgi:hypothetical protein
MKKPNYGFQKHQKELKRQRKNEEKRLRKLNKSQEQPADTLIIKDTPNKL